MEKRNTQRYFPTMLAATFYPILRAREGFIVFRSLAIQQPVNIANCCTYAR